MELYVLLGLLVKLFRGLQAWMLCPDHVGVGPRLEAGLTGWPAAISMIVARGALTCQGALPFYGCLWSGPVDFGHIFFCLLRLPFISQTQSRWGPFPFLFIWSFRVARPGMNFSSLLGGVIEGGLLLEMNLGPLREEFARTDCLGSRTLSYRNCHLEANMSLFCGSI